jgi:hypothetical protein
MKHTTKAFFAFLLILTFSHVNGQTYKSWFSRSGINFYYTGTTGSDEHIKLKVENTNSYKVEITFRFVWMYGGTIIKKEAGQMFDLGAGKEEHGDYAGLWYYAPDNRPLSSLQFNLTDIIVKPVTDNK